MKFENIKYKADRLVGFPLFYEENKHKPTFFCGSYVKWTQFHKIELSPWISFSQTVVDVKLHQFIKGNEYRAGHMIGKEKIPGLILCSPFLGECTKS